MVGEKFDMNLNFRSNPKILEFINELFFKIMTEENADINYKRDCEIEPQREDIVDDKVHIALFGAESESEKAQGVYSVEQDKGKDKKYSLLSGVDYAKYVWNMENVKWTNSSTKPKWYLTNFEQSASTIVSSAVQRSLRSLQ
jgi:hypothetical protein